MLLFASLSDSCHPKATATRPVAAGLYAPCIVTGTNRTLRDERRERHGASFGRLRARMARSRRPAGAVFVALACAVYAACALWATWPAVRHVEGHYLARPSSGEGEAAAGDHLQLGWAFWLPGHQLERGAAPWADPYSFRPEASASPNVQGWLLATPFWPLDRLFGPVWAYNLIVLLSFVAAGGFACWWLRSLGLSRAAAVVGGVAFALAPYRVGQSTGHLLGLISFLLPATLLALERRRFAWAAVALCAVPLSGQVHLAMGAVVLALGYVWARVERRHWRRAGAAPVAAIICGLLVERLVVTGSIAAGRSFAQVRRYSAELSDFAIRGVGSGVEELVFSGWLLPLAAIAGIVVVRQRRGLALFLGLSVLIPSVLALGANMPLYEPLWSALPPLRLARVPERLMPIACLALAALAAFAFQALASRLTPARVPLAAMLAVLALAVDLRVPVFGAVEPDHPNAAYAAIRGDGRMFELPVFRPDIHFGSVYLAYARQSPRERPQGYATTAKRPAALLARDLRGVSCGRGQLPASLGIRFVVVHRDLYRQSTWFARGCADAAEAALREQGWRLLAREGSISSWTR